MTIKITVDELRQLKPEEIVIVDTRSPREFEEDNIPGSINMPLFSNEERAIVGTLYKQDKIKAYEKGIGIYNKKIIKFLDFFKAIEPDKKIIIYCWRGGMRSRTIADLVSNVKENVYQLVGGYKAFRKVVREELEEYTPPFKLLVLQGMAGCGKTDLIKKLSPSIDLEGLAKHRSSLFGAIGLKPVSQKKFESRLWNKLQELKEEKIVFIEGEAKKVGDIFVPTKLFQKMEESPTIEIVSNIEKRSQRIVRDYFSHNEDEKIKEIIIKLKVFLSLKKVNELIELIDYKEYSKVAKVLLEDHYDHQYQHALINKKYIATISNDDEEEAIKQIKEIATRLINNQ